MDIKTYSFNGGREVLEEKGILTDVHEMPSLWGRYPNQTEYAELSNAMEELGGWQTEVQVDLGPPEAAHHERLTPFLDAYHPDRHVAVEHERKEQMRTRWHLMKTQPLSERVTAVGYLRGYLPN